MILEWANRLGILVVQWLRNVVASNALEDPCAAERADRT